MHILAFGYHDQQAQRHTVIQREWGQEGHTFIECHTERSGFFGKYTDLWKQYRSKKREIDTVLVTFPGHYLVPLAWVLTRFPRKKLIFDTFISLYDTLVEDRQKVGKLHPYAWFLYCVDFITMHLADQILIDTEAHADYLSQTFRLRRSKIRVVYVGTREDIFHAPIRDEDPSGDMRIQSGPGPGPEDAIEPVSGPESAFEILFFGTYIPLQGIEHILDAAKILLDAQANVHFSLIGSGQTKRQMLSKAQELALSNVTFEDRVPMTDLPKRIWASDLTLGIFGTSGKAARVIPHKVYDAVACGGLVLTQQSPAIDERKDDWPNLLTCEAGSGEAIADVIRDLLPTHNHS